jgi:serine/threonine protein kinase
MNIGPYALFGEIGHGGMGVVLKATDTRDDRPVAIKLVNARRIRDERSRLGLVREAGATASLRHPNIVSIYDVNQHRGHLYIVMEYLDGSPLDQLILRQWPLSLKHRLQIIAQLCEALGFAHERGIVHRDVKPANIFILQDGSVKVVDFGLAALAQITAPEPTQWVGTVPYMSPEQVKRTDIDGRSDIWSAGITLFELVAGRMPFAGDTIFSTFQQILNEPVPEVPEAIPLSTDLNHLLRLALHKDRAKRVSNANLFATKLRELMLITPDYRWTPPPVDAKVTEGIDQTTLISFDLIPERDQLPSERCDVAPSAGQSGAPTLPQVDGTYKPLDLGFKRETKGEVVITSSKSSVMSVIGRIRDSPSTSTVQLGVSAVAGWVLIYLLDGKYFRFFAEGIAAVWLVPPVVFRVTWMLGKFTSHPRCGTCRRPMSRRSLWTRFVKTNAELVFGYRDCVAALRSGFWEDAAKLLCIHGAELTSMYASRHIDTPFRYNLAFYECERCTERLGKLTTDVLVEENWYTRPSFVQATQGGGTRKGATLRAFANLPYTMLFILRDAIRANIIEVVAYTAIFLIVLWLFFYFRSPLN